MKPKITMTVRRADGRTTKLSTSSPPTDEMMQMAEDLVEFLSTGKKPSRESKAEREFRKVLRG